MKTNLQLAAFVLLLAGCQTTKPVVKPLPDPLPLSGQADHYADHARREPTAAPHETTSVPPNEISVPPAQIIEALIAQNDALTARLHAAGHEPATPAATPPAATLTPVTPAVISAAPTPAALSLRSGTTAGSVSPRAAEIPLLAPNAAGAIDATALDPSTTAPGSLPNPFAVRGASADPAREITFDVQGIVTGAQPCALVNGRLVEPGGTVESLRLARLDADSLILNGEGFALNLPFGATKVRLPL